MKAISRFALLLAAVVIVPALARSLGNLFEWDLEQALPTMRAYRQETSEYDPDPFESSWTPKKRSSVFRADHTILNCDVIKYLNNTLVYNFSFLECFDYSCNGNSTTPWFQKDMHFHPQSETPAGEVPSVAQMTERAGYVYLEAKFYNCFGSTNCADNETVVYFRNLINQKNAQAKLNQLVELDDILYFNQLLIDQSDPIQYEYKFLECQDRKCTKSRTTNWFKGTITDTDYNKKALLENLVNPNSSEEDDKEDLIIRLNPTSFMFNMVDCESVNCVKNTTVFWFEQDFDLQEYANENAKIKFRRYRETGRV